MRMARVVEELPQDQIRYEPRNLPPVDGLAVHSMQTRATEWRGGPVSICACDGAVRDGVRAEADGAE
jgi:hypothetical protein